MFRLDGKSAVVVGGAGGIGKTAALEMAKQGADIAVADLNVDKLGGMKNEIEESGRKLVTIQTDITSEESIDAMVKKVIEEYSKNGLNSSKAAMAIGCLIESSTK